MLYELGVHWILPALIYAALVTFVYYWTKGGFYTYWSKLGVKTPPTVPIIGNLLPLITRRVAITDYLTDLYFKYKPDRLCGIYAVSRPFLVITDNELMYRILNQDMPSFESHGLEMDMEKDPLSGHLFNASGPYWKNLRAKLTPTFTTGKLKVMYTVMEQTGNLLQDMVAGPASRGEDIEVLNVLARFATDIIGTVAFGLDINSIDDGESQFRKMGKKIFEPISFSGIVKTIVSMVLPFSGKFLNAHDKKEAKQFFVKVITDLVEHREKNQIVRNDFLDLLLKLKNNKLTDDQGKLIDFRAKAGEFTINHKELMSQVFVFFLAGFETSSSTAGFALYELALHQDVQEQARQEILKVLEEHDGKFSYEALAQMEFLGNVINETLRQFPVVNILFRQCTAEYSVPGSRVRVQPGTMVLLPIGGVHNDPELWPEPARFDPGRFSAGRRPDNLARIYMPFGQGPRICIGQRFGLLQTKLALAKLLARFRFEPCARTQVPPRYHRPGSTPNLSPADGLHLAATAL